MKKIATGLISVPMSNVPGSENVEVRNLESEDAEAANHGGFNQIEVSSLEQSPEKEEIELDDSIFNLAYLNNSPQMKVIKSANFIFNITKVSKNMKQELIKLNAALNGLGYRNLIKMAANLANNDLVQGKYYLHESNQYAVQCLGSTDYTVNLPVVGRRGVYTTKVRLIWIVNINKNSIDVDNQVFNVGSSTITLGQTYGLENSDPVYGDSEKTWTEVSLDQLRDMGGNLLGGLRVGQVSPPVSGGTPAGSGGTVQPTPSSSVASDWKEYMAKGDTEKKIGEIWSNSNKIRPEKSKGVSYDNSFSSFVSWWNTLKDSAKYKENVLTTLQNLNLEAPVAAGATAPAAAPVPTGAVVSRPTPQVSTSMGGGVANLMDINGTQYYTIPAGKYNLFVRKGNPYGLYGIMMQDTRSRKISPPQDISKSPRLREYLGSREIKRILEMVKAAEGSEAVPKYEAVLKGQRLEESRLRRLFTTKKKQEKIKQEAEKYKSTSARQSRLDNLRKKGII